MPTTPFGAARTIRDIPIAGTAWVEVRLLQLLDIAVGDIIEIGAARFTISQVLLLEPDRGGDLFNLAPRVLINFDDLASTELILPGSRARYSLLLAGESATIERYRDALELMPHERLVDPSEARPEIRTALESAEQYLTLASLTAVLLAGVAILLAARAYAARHQDMSAILATLGARQSFIAALFGLELLMTGIVASAIGVGLGLAAHYALAELMSGWTQAALPPPTMSASVRGFATGLITLAGFALPPLLSLRKVPPVRVLRGDVEGTPTSRLAIAVYCAIAMLLLAPWRSGDWKITLLVPCGHRADPGDTCLLGLVSNHRPTTHARQRPRNLAFRPRQYRAARARQHLANRRLRFGLNGITRAEHHPTRFAR